VLMTNNYCNNLITIYFNTFTTVKMSYQAVSKFYAVRRGRTPGIYTSWAECKRQVYKHPMNRYACFHTMSDAVAFMSKRSHSNNQLIRQSEAKLDSKFRQSRSLKRLPNQSVTLSSTKRRVCQVVEKNTAPSQGVGGNMAPRSWSSIASRTVSRGSMPPFNMKRRFPKPTFDFNYFQPQPGHIYIDGACLDNGTPNAHAGVGVFFGPNDERNVSERLTGSNQTSCRAEIQAAIRALECSERKVT
jgi:ribonuclease HI